MPPHCVRATKAADDLLVVVGDGQEQWVNVYGLGFMVVSPEAVDNELFILRVGFVGDINIHF